MPVNDEEYPGVIILGASESPNADGAVVSVIGDIETFNAVQDVSKSSVSVKLDVPGSDNAHR